MHLAETNKYRYGNAAGGRRKTLYEDAADASGRAVSVFLSSTISDSE
jgi:hypothetical protein